MEAEFFSPFAEIAKEAVFVLLFIVGLTLLNVGGSELEHAIEQAREFVGPGVDGGGCAESSLEAADKCPDGRLALHRSLGRQSEHRGRAILGLSRSGTEQFAAADAIVRTEFEPGTKVLFASPTAHVQARFGDDDLHGQGTQARQTSQINSANAAQMSLALQSQANLGRA